MMSSSLALYIILRRELEVSIQRPRFSSSLLVKVAEQGSSFKYQACSMQSDFKAPFILHATLLEIGNLRIR